MEVEMSHFTAREGPTLILINPKAILHNTSSLKGLYIVAMLQPDQHFCSCCLEMYRANQYQKLYNA